MRMSSRAASALLALMMGCLFVVTTASPASAQTPPRCPPGQPPGRPPGQPPTRNPTPAAERAQRPNYPPGRCKLALSRTFAERTGTFSASGDGFVPGETVTLTIAGQQVKTVLAGADGTFSTTLVVPASAPIGPTEVRAISDTQVLSAAFEVVASGAAAPGTSAAGTLPRTGTEVAGIGGAGALLIGIGTVAVVLSRRRRSTQ